MGLRFRRSIKLFPGLKINLSKSGPSLSVGGRGHTLNISSREARATVGIPGTGMSYSQRLTSPTAASHPSEEQSSSGAAWFWLIFLSGILIALLVHYLS